MSIQIIMLHVQISKKIYLKNSGLNYKSSKDFERCNEIERMVQVQAIKYPISNFKLYKNFQRNFVIFKFKLKTVFLKYFRFKIISNYPFEYSVEYNIKGIDFKLFSLFHISKKTSNLRNSYGFEKFRTRIHQGNNLPHLASSQHVCILRSEQWYNNTDDKWNHTL